MKRPLECVVAGIPYEIRWLDESPAGDDPERLGFSDHEQAVLGVRIPRQSEAQLRDTLLHEILHAVAAQTYLDGPAVSSFVDKDHAERAIATFSTHLLDTLRRNPDVVAFLLAPDE